MPGRKPQSPRRAGDAEGRARSRSGRGCAGSVVQPAATPAAPISADQLMRDIAEIERVRDALAAQPAPVFAKGRTQALTLVPARTTMRFRW